MSKFRSLLLILSSGAAAMAFAGSSFPANQPPPGESGIALPPAPLTPRANGLLPDACGPDWAQKIATTSPSPRRNFSLAYDSGRLETVLYGGYGASNLNDTWIWDGVNWTQKSTPTAPSASWGTGMAYDSVRAEMVLFGGWDGAGFINATWVWNGTVWAQRSPALSPSPRQVFTMAFDSVRGEVVLFGGYNSVSGALNDTWTWNGSTWTQQSPALSPSARTEGRAAFDAAHGELILFGGSTGAYVNETWVWNGATWAQKSVATPPPVRGYGALAATRGGVLLYGGADGVNRLGDSWLWDGTNWTQLATAGNPPARFGHALAFDAARSEVLLFGGWDGATNFSDTWVESPGTMPVIAGPAANTCPTESVNLSTQSFFTYQWNRDGVAISGATTWNYSATQSGSYTVTVTSASCGTQTSAARPVTINLCPCTTPPKFGGATSVLNGQQSVCSLAVNWNPAILSCGSSLSYSVYRSPTPGFTPSAATRIATGVIANRYDDYWNLSNNTPYYYIVRATDDRGNTDPNSVEKSNVPTGPVTAATFFDTFEGNQSGGGFDNPGWTHNPIAGTADWTWSSAQSQSPSFSWYSASQPAIADRVLTTPPLNLLASSRLSFWHTYAFEGSPATCFDGGSLETSVNGGAWTPLPAAAFTLGSFNGTISTGFGNPIAGQPAWCGGVIGPMTEVRAGLGNYAGQSVKLRWHAGEDSSTSNTGWFVDSVLVTGVGTAQACACPAPSGLANNTAADVSACATTGIAVAWTAPASWGDGGAGMRTWTVLRNNAPIAAGPCSGTLSQTTLNCVDTTAAAGVTYSYQIRAANGCGSSTTTSGASAADVNNAPSGTGDWTLKNPATRPTIRSRASVGYDGVRSQVVLFGGYNGSNLNDTWTWDGVNWMQKSPITSPSSRDGAGMAFDTARSEMVLFGGSRFGTDSNETWSWDGSNWSMRTPATRPSARRYHAVAYDTARGEVVLFGGCSSSCSLSDTWVWNGTTWTQKFPANSPPARGVSAMAYDPIRGETVLYGGYNGADLSDTWVWNGVNWSQRNPVTSPGPRDAHAMTFDPSAGKVVLFGSWSTGNGTWQWDGTNWAQVATASTPSDRSGVALTYDVARGQLLLFGGAIGWSTYYNDTWVYQSALAVIGLNANTCPDETVALSVPTFTSYQWNLNGTPISGATAQNYIVSTSGNYSATVTNASGCSATTPNKAVTITAPCPCPRPSGLANNTAADVSACAAGIQVAWTPPANWNDGGIGARTWTVLRGGAPITSGPCSGALAETVLNCIDNTAPAGVALTYSIRAVNGCGSTQTTAGVSATDVNNFPTGTGDWTLKNPVVKPSVRERAAIAYDRARGQTVLFSGLGAGNDTWVWDGVNWTQKFPVTSPSARYEAAMTYDETRNETVLFGGSNGSGETWVWDGAAWTQKLPAISPPGRSAARMAFDAARGEIVMFGGNGFNDTWVWNGANWSQKTVSTPPPVRGFHALVYDRVRGETVLFGGWISGGTTFNDTWTWDGTNWTQKTPATRPTQRSNLAFTFDDSQGKAVIFGNFNGAGDNQFWAWDGANWSQIITATSPAARYSAAMAYDAARGQVMMMGGYSTSGDLNDTWVYQGALAVIGPSANTCPDETVVTLSVPAYASYQWNLGGTPISGATGQNYIVSTSGNYSATVTNASGCSATTPNKAVTITAPCPCPRPSGLANNTAADVSACAAGIQVAWTPPANWNDGGIGARTWTVLRGGVPIASGPCSGALAETILNCIDDTAPAGVALTYSVRAVNGCGSTQTTTGVSATDVNNFPTGTGDWTLNSPATAPPVREAPGVVYDLQRGQVVMFGGYYGSGSVRSDTWVWDGVSWTQKLPATSPPARGYAVMVYDETRRETVLFGGFNGSINLGDTWVWDGVNWTQKFPATSPSARDLVAAAYDGTRQEVVLFGGNTSNAINETWTWNGTNWTQKFPATIPSTRFGSKLVYDPVRAETVLFSGYNVLADTWVWNGVNWTQKFPAVSPTARSYYGATFDPAQGKALIFGNWNGSSGDNQFWAWDGSTWSQLSTVTTPSVRYSPGMIFDSSRGQVVLFGGGRSYSTQFNDTWVYQSALAVIGPNANTCPSETVVLSVPAFTSYQWNLNGTPIAGATAQNYTVTASGNYSATVTNGSGCTATTPGKTVTLTSPCPCAFSGLVSAASAGQASCGINLGWNPAAGGCGPGVTYNVYRSIGPGFTPSPGNRIATGLTALTYADNASVTSGTNYYYVARSVSGIGVEDGNTVEKSAAPAGPVTTATFTDTFEGALSGGGFDNAGWTHAPISGVTDWVWSTAQSDTPTHSWYSQSVNSASKGLVSPDLNIIASSTLTFYHTYNTEFCCDHLYLEVSVNGGATWSSLPAAAFTAGAYNCGTDWCGGTIGAMTRVAANLAAYAGQTIRLRWRETDDSSVTYTGWYVDSVTVSGSVPTSCTSTCTPPSPTITAPSGCSAGSVLLSTQAYAGYQWYRNGAAIPGATSQTYTATLTGSYTVTAQTTAGCAAGSPVYAVTIAGCCPPVIAGNTAADANGCAITGVDVGWSAPTNWGDGGTGARSIAVLRNAAVLSSGGCAAPAATLTTCTDATGPAGVSYNYSVRFTNGCGAAATTTGASAADLNNSLTFAWLLRNPVARPPARSLHGAAYDAARGRVVLFGGANASGFPLSDTWIWDGVNWTQAAPAASPTARYGMSMAYDPVRGETVLFGGYDGAYKNDTWTWNGTNWSQKSPTVLPPPLYHSAMAFDAARSEMVLFGGYTGSIYVNETWVWNGVNWLQKFPTSSPPPRYAAGMAYDAVRGETVLFGGTGAGVLGDTWVWNGVNWLQKTPAASPAPRAYLAAAFDPGLGQVLVLGCDSCSDAGQTWGWNGTTWTALSLNPSFSARNSATLAHDAVRQKMLLFGGLDAGATAQNDTWVLNLPTVAPLYVIKAGGGGQATFTWPDISLATTYTVYQDPLPAGSYAAITGTASSGNPGLLVPMPAGASLFFKVAAANSCGQGPK